MMSTRLVLVVTLLAGCPDAPLTITELPCPDQGTTLTYQNFGERFFADYCDRCHDTARNGAPTTFRFDTLDRIRMHSDRIFVRAAGPNTTMPPGATDPPSGDRDQLAEWLACGAPE